MKFATGSHLWDFTDQTIDQGHFAVPDGATWREEAAVMQAGGASFHHCLTLHGSGPNVSGATRCSLAIHLRTEKSWPHDGNPFTSFLDDDKVCPIIFGEKR